MMAYINNIEDRDAAETKVINCLREQASRAVREKMKERKLSEADIALLCHIDNAALFRALRNELTMPMESLRILSYDIFHESLHELMFGEKRPTKLPTELECFINTYTSLTVKDKKTLMDYTFELMTENNGAKTASVKYIDIIRDRLQEMRADQWIGQREVLGPKCSPSTREYLALLAGKNPKSVEGSITMLMRFAMISGNSLDYFLVRDYTTFTEVVHENQKGEETVVEDICTRTLLSHFLRLNNEAQASVLAKTFELFLLQKR